MPKNVLAILGHPRSDSFCGALFDSYVAGAQSAGAEVRSIRLEGAEFNPVFEGYEDPIALEPELEAAQEAIRWANHIVIAYPVWWGSVPAVLKGFIDRTLLPGFAFGYQENSPLPARLLKGKTGRLLLTMDAPTWYYRLVYKRASEAMMRHATLEFCGIRPVRVSRFGRVSLVTDARRKAWLETVQALGRAQV